MPQFRTGPIVQIISERVGLQRVLVRIDGADQRAYNLPELTGAVSVGDEVVCNTTAVSLGLGTGGWHVVHWNLSRRTLDQPGGGHIMKVRYTSLQADTGAAEERHPDLPQRIDGVPVVVCSLHSQLASVGAAFAAIAPGRRLVYVMTDGAALPVALSDLVVRLRDRGLIAGVVTAGHAFGGDEESVNVVSALCIAVHVLRADAVVVAMGPGVVGTATLLGTTAYEVVGGVADVSAIGGRPVLCLRAGDADARDRHQGISHHSRTALAHAVGGAIVGIPRSWLPLADGIGAPHDVRIVDTGDVATLLAASGVRVTTMGRSPDEDPMPFAFAAAAGTVAAQLVLADPPR